MVFLIDHHDGSCCYTEKNNGKSIIFDPETPFFKYEDMHDRVKVRETEIKLFIDEVCSNAYLQTLGFSDKACLDTSKLVMAGHSMGGTTALRVGNSDDRVSCVLTHDPWLFPLYKEILNGSFCSFTDKNMFILNTSSFFGMMPGFDGQKMKDKLVSGMDS